MGVFEGGDHGFWLATHDDETVLLGNRSVVRQSVELVVLAGRPHLGDGNLDFIGLTRLREDRAERLGVRVRETSAGHVRAVVLVAT